MARAPKKCLTAGCSQPAFKKGRCRACYQPWAQTSPRNRTRPASAGRLVRQVRRRDRNTCYQCGGPGHLVDHIDPIAEGGDWSLENMACICEGCHAEKTAAEAARGRARRR